MASPVGLTELGTALRLDIGPSFINGSANDLLRFFQNPAIKDLCNGQFLRQIIANIVDPPTFWNILIAQNRDGIMTDPVTQSFAWLLFELISDSNNNNTEYASLAEKMTTSRRFLDSGAFETRILGQKIKHVLDTLKGPVHDYINGPGGRHDNDMVDFRAISILPTADELSSSEPAFLRRASEVGNLDEHDRIGAHLDNQFRLLREDLLGELRDDLQAIINLKRAPRGTKLSGLELSGTHCGSDRKRKPFGLVFRCPKGITQLSKLKSKERKDYLGRNKNFLKHGSIACLLSDDHIVAFAQVERDEDLLAEEKPRVILIFSGEEAPRKALLEAKLSSELQLIQVDTPYFAYEPFLKRLQDKRELQLAEQLLFFRDLDIILPEQSQIASTVVALQKGPHNNLQGVLRTPNPVKLDESQVASLIAGLGQAVSLIQGPPGKPRSSVYSTSILIYLPGTGKSFIGALLAKVFFQATEQPILVICYTNHALDQFLQDLMSIGIPAGEMVRLGTKSSYATKHLSLFEQSGPYRRSANAWNIINNCKIKTADLEDKIKQAISNYLNQKITKSDFLWHLALPPEDPSFSEGLSVPDLAEDETLIGEKGKRVGPHYLLDRWAAGKDAGLFAENMSKDRAKIWAIPRDTRLTHLNRWRLAILQEKIADIYSDVEKYNSALTQLNDMLNEKNAQIIKSKRIVGCTTTGAAMYARELQAFQQGIVIVEEAGEVLESHVLTSIGPKTRQLVLIGDHKQLRPKVNNYKLTVERGEGYDLNRSLFERLIREGLPSTTLQQQHRMCPEISSLVRTLTYPDLLDAPSTKSRPELRGFQERVMFVDHNHLETELHHVTERRDQNAKSSRQNQFEVDMVLQCVRYLGQQGYRTENITILTPYLAQLKLLRDTLAHSMDPILNDLDSFDLVQAGLMPAASAVHSRRPIKISTIGKIGISIHHSITF